MEEVRVVHFSDKVEFKFQVPTQGNITVFGLKCLIERESSISSWEQRLIYPSHEVSDDMTLKSLGLTPKSTIYMIRRKDIDKRMIRFVVLCLSGARYIVVVPKNASVHLLIQSIANQSGIPKEKLRVWTKNQKLLSPNLQGKQLVEVFGPALQHDEFVVIRNSKGSPPTRSQSIQMFYKWCKRMTNIN